MRAIHLISFLVLTACAAAPVAEAPEPPPPAEEETRSIEGIAAPEPDFGGLTPAEKCAGSGYHCVRVIYGTTRNRDGTGPGDQRGYGTEAETGDPHYAAPAHLLQLPTTARLETGEVIVTIPALHQPGDSIRRKSSDRDTVSEDERDDVFSFLRPPEPFDSYDAFASTVDAMFADANENDALLHVHGFNVSFRNGAFRSAQLKSDTSFEGPVFFFSWPSDDRLRAYFSDQIDGDVSARALANYLIQIEEQLPPGGEIHVVAHSMGTRVFSQAVALLRDSGAWEGRESGEQGPLFGAVILAAGDLDSGLAREWLGPPERLAQSVTFLTSHNDRAVALSGFFRNMFVRDPRRRKSRIGYYRPKEGPVIFPGVNVFDISYLKDRFWERFISINHSTYAEDVFSLRYISQLIDDPKTPPEVLVLKHDRLRRCRREIPGASVAYWVIGAVSGRRACSTEFESQTIRAASTVADNSSALADETAY
ncbi:MAG: alpha/beta hydrolase [Pseudomonadota bacterium]